MKRKTVCYLIKIDRVSAVTDGEHNDKSIGSSVYRISRYYCDNLQFCTYLHNNG